MTRRGVPSRNRGVRPPSPHRIGRGDESDRGNSSLSDGFAGSLRKWGIFEADGFCAIQEGALAGGSGGQPDGTRRTAIPMNTTTPTPPASSARSSISLRPQEPAAPLPTVRLTLDARLEQGMGRWSFCLEPEDDGPAFFAEDWEPDVTLDRLRVLTLVRALEALDRPTRIVWADPLDELRHALRFGVPEWRANGWRSEAFGLDRFVPEADLWRRVDRALRFHTLTARPQAGRRLRSDAPHARGVPAPLGRRTAARTTSLRGEAPLD